MFNSAKIKYFSLLSVLLTIGFWQSGVWAQTQILQNANIAVVYEPPLKDAAGELLRIYPHLRKDLEAFLGWRLAGRPHVVLVKTNQAFQKITRNELIVAFAVPDKNLIVIDYSRMSTRPFNLSISFKHELCHLLLHEHIDSAALPKWLDEGVCQWVSDGIGEILIDQSRSELDAAVMSGQTYRLSRIAKKFPGSRSALTLAYEQSKSVVSYIDRQYGKQTIIAILGDLKNGESIETAIFQNMAFSLNQLEEEWLEHIERTPRWLVFLANNLYGILFFLASILTICGFYVRLLHKRRWEDEQEEDD